MKHADESNMQTQSLKYTAIAKCQHDQDIFVYFVFSFKHLLFFDKRTFTRRTFIYKPSRHLKKHIYMPSITIVSSDYQHDHTQQSILQYILPRQFLSFYSFIYNN